MKGMIVILLIGLELVSATLFSRVFGQYFNFRFGGMPLLQANVDPSKIDLVGALYIAIASLAAALGVVFALFLKSNKKQIDDANKSSTDKLEMAKMHREAVEELLKKNTNNYVELIEQTKTALRDQTNGLKDFMSSTERHFNTTAESYKDLARLIKKQLKIDDE